MLNSVFHRNSRIQIPCTRDHDTDCICILHNAELCVPQAKSRFKFHPYHDTEFFEVVHPPNECELCVPHPKSSRVFRFHALSVDHDTPLNFSVTVPNPPNELCVPHPAKPSRSFQIPCSRPRYSVEFLITTHLQMTELCVPPAKSRSIQIPCCQ